MKLTLVLVLLCLSLTLCSSQKQQSTTTLLEDLEEFQHIAVKASLRRLVRRYLLNDKEFQGAVRTINSPDAYFLLARIKAQPEIVSFTAWLRSQNLATGEPTELPPTEETTESFTIFDPAPFWVSNVNGFHGFMREFEIYYQQSMIKSHISQKLLQNGAFAQLWKRIVALRPVYERALNFPETQQLLLQLQNHGVNVNYVDKFVRNQFDWLNVNTTTVSTTIAPPTTSTLAP